MTRGTKVALFSAVMMAGAVGTVALAQSQYKRAILQRADVTGAEAKECVFGSAELPPGTNIGKHIHHGFELGYVTGGEAELTVEGEPPRRVKEGDSWRIDALRPHDARSVGTTPFKVVAAWVVEKGKPLAEPVK